MFMGLEPGMNHLIRGGFADEQWTIQEAIGYKFDPSSNQDENLRRKTKWIL